MTKITKIILLAIITCGLIITGVYFSLSSTILNINSDIKDLQIKITDLKKSKNNIKIISPNQPIRLEKSDYKIESELKKYTFKEQTIILNTKTNIDLDVDFSDDYYKQNFLPQAEQITDIIKTKYSMNFAVNTVWRMSQKGEYFIATLTKIPENPSNFGMFDIFKIIFKKDHNQWIQLTEPELVFYKDDFSQIPVRVLKQANDILMLE